MGYFQNTKSCKGIISSLFFYFNKKWERRTERIDSIALYFSPGMNQNGSYPEAKVIPSQESKLEYAVA